ncbi:transposase [Wenzhouxiangella sp. C33]|uniref:Transposase n=1 Tax=Wenzhouxiangella limi TaxID=2707351 RepID=A0A845UXQ9_9GAMM|nr:transposase [Wenzhouxiangella limi]
MQRHQDAVLAFISNRMTNAVAEGLNRIVTNLKNRVIGFRPFDAFSETVYLRVGGLNLPGQIRARLQRL